MASKEEKVCVTSGILGLISSHNVATRWIIRIFLMVVTISARSWNVCSTFEKMQRHFPKIGVSVVFTIEFIVSLVHLTRIFVSLVILLSAFFLRMGSLFPEQVMESFSSSVSTVPSFHDVFSHNMWNLLLELLFHEHVCGVFETFVDEIDLAKIALSCHFALDLLCLKEGVFDST